jgi:hypothetical protein
MQRFQNISEENYKLKLFMITKPNYLDLLFIVYKHNRSV